jgi:hypothetical protein
MKGLQNLNSEGPVLVEPFSDSLKAMPFEDMRLKRPKSAWIKSGPAKINGGV